MMTNACHQYKKTFEWTMLVSGLIGAALVSLNLGSTYMVVALLIFMSKDVVCFFFFRAHKMHIIAWNSVAFFIIDCVGIYRHAFA